MRILLAEAELERVPAEIQDHPVVRKHAKGLGRKPGQLLLDQNHHRQACLRLEDGERRGRPDIVHYTLLALLESPLCKEGKLEVAIHTRQGALIRIRPDTRLPRGEVRFQGLMAKVLAEGASQDKEPLLWVEGTFTPQEVLARFAEGPVTRLDERGDAWAPTTEGTLVLGAYPSGDFSAAWQEAVPASARVFDQPLNAWAVAADVVARARL